MKIDITRECSILNYLDEASPITKNESRRSTTRYSIPQIPITVNNYRFFSSETTHVEADRRSPEERDRDRQRNAAIIGGLVFTAASFIFGFTLKNYFNLKQELSDDRENLRSGNLRSFSVGLDNLVKNKLCKDEITYGKAAKIALATFGVLAGSAALGVGGLMGSATLISLGAVATVASVAGGLFSIAWHWDDGKKINQLQMNIDSYASDIRNMLNSSPPAYSYQAPSAPPQD